MPDVGIGDRDRRVPRRHSVRERRGTCGGDSEVPRERGRESASVRHVERHSVCRVVDSGTVGV